MKEKKAEKKKVKGVDASMINSLIAAKLKKKLIDDDRKSKKISPWTKPKDDKKKEISDEEKMKALTCTEEEKFSKTKTCAYPKKQCGCPDCLIDDKRKQGRLESVQKG